MTNPDSIKEARERMSEHFEDGIKCPCCGQFVKKYKRKLNSGMALTLVRLYKHHPETFVDVKDFLRQHKYKNSHDWTLLRHWGFLTTNAEGLWKITPTGIQWIKFGYITHSHIFMYNNKMMGFGEGTITFKEALGASFSLEELMKIEKTD